MSSPATHPRWRWVLAPACLTAMLLSASALYAQTATALRFVQQPTDVDVGEQIDPPVTVEAVDAFGTRVTSFGTRIHVEILSNPGGGSLGGRKHDDPQDGLATFDNLTISEPGEGYTLRATASGVTSATSASFDVEDDDDDGAERLAFGQQPLNAVAGAVISPVTVRAVDSDGQTDTSFTGSITISKASGPSAGQLQGTLTRPAASGVATFSDLSLEVTGTYTLSAASSPLDGATSAAFTITPGPPSTATSQITASPTSIPANGSSTSTITVQLEDAFGNPRATGGNTITLSTNLGSVTSAATDNGNGTYTGTLTSGTVAGIATVSGSIDGSPITDSAAVSLTPAGTTRLEFGQQPTGAAAGAVISPAVTIRAVTLGVTDPTFNGPVTLSIVTGPSGGQLLGTTTRNASAGVATFDDLSIELTGTYTLRATSGALAPDTSAAFTITPGPPSGATSEITAAPASIPADGSSTSTVSVRLRDSFGNPMTGGGNSVTLTTDLGSLGPVSDGGDGTYSATLTSSTTSGTAVVTGTVDGADIDDTASVVFSAGPPPTPSPTPSPANSRISADPVTIRADGISTSTITVQLIDASGVPLASGGDTVTLATNLGTIGPVSDHGNGAYSATLTSTSTPGAATISGTVNGATIGDTAIVTFATGSADIEVEVTVSDDSPTVGEDVALVVTVRNGGPETATGVQVLQAIPARLALASATASQGNYDAATGVWSVGSVAPAGRATLTLVFVVTGEESN